LASPPTYSFTTPQDNSGNTTFTFPSSQYPYDVSVKDVVYLITTASQYNGEAVGSTKLNIISVTSVNSLTAIRVNSVPASINPDTVVYVDFSSGGTSSFYEVQGTSGTTNGYIYLNLPYVGGMAVNYITKPYYTEVLDVDPINYTMTFDVEYSSSAASGYMRPAEFAFIQQHRTIGSTTVKNITGQTSIRNLNKFAVDQFYAQNPDRAIIEQEYEGQNNIKRPNTFWTNDSTTIPISLQRFGDEYARVAITDNSISWGSGSITPYVSLSFANNQLRLQGTSSWATNAISASYSLSSSRAISSSQASIADFSTTISVNPDTTSNTFYPVPFASTAFGNASLYSDSSIINFNPSTNRLFITSISSSNITGSSFTGSFTGSLFGTASWAQSASNALTASRATSASYALSASYAPGGGSAFPYTGSALITGSLGITGSLSVTSSAVTVASFNGNQNGYIEFSLKNNNTGISASTDIACYADNGSAISNYIDMGIMGSGYTGASYDGIFLGRANDSYLYNDGGHLAVGNANNQTASGSLFLFAHPNGLRGNAGITITGSNIGINKTGSINANLDISGSAIISNQLTIGSSSQGPNENTLTLGARDTANEGGQLGFNAPGGTYASASFIDLYQNRLRILKGTNTSSTGEVATWNMHNLQMQLPAYTSISAFTGSTAALLAVDSSGNIITNGRLSTYRSFSTGSTVGTGSTSLTATTSFLIPANTFTTGDILRVRYRVRKLATNGNTTTGIYINTTNDISTATTLGILTANTTLMQMKRDFYILAATGINTEHVGVGTSLATDDTSTGRAASTINWAADQYIIFGITHTNTNDSAYSTMYYLERV
jgi:hypothetical protein